jgi:hypothetical protein
MVSELNVFAKFVKMDFLGKLIIYFEGNVVRIRGSAASASNL